MKGRPAPPGLGKDYLILGVFLLAVAVFPLIIANKYLISVMIFLGMYTIIVSGYNLLMGYAGQVSLGHAAFWGLGAYVSGVLTAQFGVHPWIAFAAAMIFNAAVAFLIGYPTLKLTGHYLAMATLGLGIIIQIFFINLNSLTMGPSGLTGIPRISIAGYVFNNDFRYYYFVWFFVALTLIITLNVVNSRVGRALRAINSSEVAAASMGIHVAKYKVQIFMLSAVFASIAGSLYVHYLTFVSPETFSFWASIVLLIMVVFGGVGTFWGPILGAIVLTLIPEYLRAYGDLHIFLYGLMLVVVMVFMPSGVIGIFSSLRMKFGK